MIRIDLDDLEHLLNGSANESEPRGSAQLEQALNLFRGEPLTDIDWIWAEGHARQLRATYVDLLTKVGQHRIDEGDAPNGSRPRFRVARHVRQPSTTLRFRT